MQLGGSSVCWAPAETRALIDRQVGLWSPSSPGLISGPGDDQGDVLSFAMVCFNQSQSCFLLPSLSHLCPENSPRLAAVSFDIPSGLPSLLASGHRDGPGSSTSLLVLDPAHRLLSGAPPSLVSIATELPPAQEASSPPYSESLPLEQILRTGGAGQRCEPSASSCHCRHPSNLCGPAQPTLFLLPSILTPGSHLQPPTPPTFLQPLHSLCITEDLGAGNDRQTGSLTNCVSAGLCGSWPQAGDPGVFAWALCGWKGWPSLSLGKTSRLDRSLVPAWASTVLPKAQ